MEDRKRRNLKDKEFPFAFGMPFINHIFENLQDAFPFGGEFPYCDYNRKDYDSGIRMPKTNIKQDNDGYTILIEIPGISKEEIELEVTDDELWLNTHNKDYEKKYKKHIHFRKPINSNEIKANLNSGILKIKIPYSEKMNKRKINIDE